MEKNELKIAVSKALQQILAKPEWHRQRAVFAEKAGLSAGFLTQLAKGEKTPSLEKLSGLAHAAGMTTSDFLKLGKCGDSCNQKPVDSNHVISINHEKLVSRFQDKDLAYRLNEALIAIENLNPQLFEDVANYVLKTAEDQKILSQYRPTRICEHLRVCEKKK